MRSCGGLVGWLPVCALAALAGCGHSEVRFVLNREGQLTPKEIEARIRKVVGDHNEAEAKRETEAEKAGSEFEPKLRDEDQEVQEALDRRQVHDEAIVDILWTMFGTPDAPVAWGGTTNSGLNERHLRLAAGAADDPQGRGLYRKHCVHCHGVSGDGNGPTARFLNPYPRDFRFGLFKFKSTSPDAAKPTREDLRRTIREGINGTAMPSFKVLLKNDEIDALAEYVVYLSMRGRTELDLRDPQKNDTGLVDDNITSDEQLTREVYKKIIDEVKDRGEASAWDEAAKQVFTPPPRDEAAIAKLDGARLFAGAPGKDGKNRVECTKCHGPSALGDGPSASENFDKWNEAKWKLLQAGNGPDVIERRFDLPLQRLSPRNLRLGAYRGGRRPVDLFRRIALGIGPSAMPAHASIKRDTEDVDKDEDREELVMETAADKLEPQEIWALVDYVLSLPYQEGGELHREVAQAPH
jgi:mono/diheme cytochrome c family protein